MTTSTAASPLELSSRLLCRLLATWAIAFVFLGLAILVVAIPFADPHTGIDLSVGQSSNQDILAPGPLTYESVALTNRARADAAAAVPDVYDPPDARVGRQQVLLL